MPRLIEERMLLALRQGKVSKWFSGIGQEAISVGATLALEADEWILPLHRNLGVFTSRNMPLSRLFAQLLGKASGYSQGRERSFHFGSHEHHIVGMISHLGPQLCVADGIALAQRLNKRRKVTLVFSGEGGTSQGDFHEALNLASVWELPVIFLIENNGYALSTPTRQQYRCNSLVERADAYGMEGHQIDGNDLLLVQQTVSELAKSMRENPRPVLLECLTFRMRGHEEASGTAYVPASLLSKWATRDPLQRFEKFMFAQQFLTAPRAMEIRQDLSRQISQAFETALLQEAPLADTQKETRDVYRVFVPTAVAPGHLKRELRYLDAIAEGMQEAMARYPQLIFMGQDVAEYGGVFKVSQGLWEKFGSERVRNTPLCESAIVGATLGLSVAGFKSIMEMQFADFASCAFNQIINNLAKVQYRWGQNADVVIRLPGGGGVGAGPFHSQSLESIFAHIPGLKIVYPAFAEDAKGLLLAAVEDPNPVLYFEHKALYRRHKAEVATGYYTTPIGKARQILQGNQVSIITYGMGVHWALELLKAYPEIQATLLDLRTLLPLDEAAIFQAVASSGKALVLHEDNLTGGLGGEIAALIAQHCFEYLDAPVIRCAGLDTPVPFARSLEANFMAQARFKEQLFYLLAY